jgi:hypothetical protein
MLSTGETYRDLGGDHFTNRNPERQNLAASPARTPRTPRNAHGGGPWSPERTFPTRQKRHSRSSWPCCQHCTTGVRAGTDPGDARNRRATRASHEPCESLLPVVPSERPRGLARDARSTGKSSAPAHPPHPSAPLSCMDSGSQRIAAALSRMQERDGLRPRRRRTLAARPSGLRLLNSGTSASTAEWRGAPLMRGITGSARIMGGVIRRGRPRQAGAPATRACESCCSHEAATGGDVDGRPGRHVRERSKTLAADDRQGPRTDCWR